MQKNGDLLLGKVESKARLFRVIILEPNSQRIIRTSVIRAVVSVSPGAH